MRNLSWEPKPKDWPENFDGTVSASAHGGLYRIEALGDRKFRAVFIRADECEVLPQTGVTRSDAATAVYAHRHAISLGGCTCHLCGEHASGQPSAEAAQTLIAESFNAYFANFEVRIAPDEVVDGAHKTIQDASWSVTYRVDLDDAGMPSLEFYATSRWTNDRHVKISAFGERERVWTRSAKCSSSDPRAPTRTPQRPSSRLVTMRSSDSFASADSTHTACRDKSRRRSLELFAPAVREARVG